MAPDLGGFVVLAPVVVVTALTALVCFVILIGFLYFIEPLFAWMTNPNPGFLGRIIRWVTKPAVALVDNFKDHMKALLARTFAGAVRPLNIYLNQYAQLVSETYRLIADLSFSTWEAIDTLTTQTIPREVGKGVAGVKATLANHTRRLDTLESLNRQVSVVIGDALRALPWGVAGSYVGNFERWLDSYRHLWNQTFNFIAPKLNTLATVTVPEIVRDVGRLTARVAALEAGATAELWQRLQALEARIDNAIEPQLDALRQSVDLLAELVTGTVGESLTTLYERVAALETQLEARIETALAPLAERVLELETTLEELLGAGLETLVQRVTQLEAQMVDFIGTATATLAERVTQIEAQLEAFVGTQTAALAARVTALETAIQTQIQLQLDGLLGRIEALETSIATVIVPAINRLEAILEPAAFAALVLATMRTVAPNLFCRNVTETSKALCTADPTLIDDVLAFAFPLLLLADICGLAHAIRSAANLFEPVLRGILEGISSVADCASIDPAPDLPLRAAALPSPTAALAL